MSLHTEDQKFIDEAERKFNELMPEVFNSYSGLGKGPVLKQVIRFYKKYDERISELAGSIACAAGCDFCCHYHVVATAPEIFAIAEHLAKMPKAEKTKIQERIKETASRVSKMAVSEYMVTNIPCAMLENGRCSIYELRPLACRGHHSVDAKICERTFNAPQEDEPMELDYDRKLTVTALEAAHLTSQREKKLDTAKYELHAALNTAIWNKDVFKRWLEHKLSFPNVRDKHLLTGP